MAKPREPSFYKCPRKDCTGQVNYVGKDTQEQSVFKCDTCAGFVGEQALEREDRLRRMED